MLILFIVKFILRWSHSLCIHFLSCFFLAMTSFYQEKSPWVEILHAIGALITAFQKLNILYCACNYTLSKLDFSLLPCHYILFSLHRLEGIMNIHPTVEWGKMMWLLQPLYSLWENENSPSAPGFAECQISGTWGRNALGEESLPRVPNSPWHSGKRGTRGRPPSPSAFL
jgi:hypothetical protein